MKFGISYFATHMGADPAELAIDIERLGFESYFVSEHSHIPVDTDFPLADEVPMPYRSMFDPFLSLAAAAAVTKRIKLGTAICIIPQHDPVNLAKTISTLDQISNGRAILGIGAGWNPPEMENHRVAFADRFRITRERIEAMKELWTKEEAEYAGKLVNITRSWQWPKPVQQPYPPILVAGSGANIIKRCVDLGDGWMPVFAIQWHESLRNKQTPLDDLPEMAAELRRRAEEAGKPRPTITAMGLPPTPEYMDLLEEHGVDRLMLGLPPEGKELAFETLESHAQAVSAYL
ncbi:MAG: LLM class F420-dependent oxidoreductase [Gammaproteobacteria bacterium]|jgi:probable F420-dependent oxidoreductase|nr:LLM class F420-dependent oxidoreductase [Gammaproteobacteria bacterium]|tara:strand:+ start:678 stop:1547 length:870 start_codon:yes stop_codon:yes gene_type:complete